MATAGALDPRPSRNPHLWLPTAKFGSPLLAHLDGFSKPHVRKGVQYDALRHAHNKDARCDLCPRDCSWFRLEGDTRDGGRLECCYSCSHKDRVLNKFRSTAPVRSFCWLSPDELARAEHAATSIMLAAPGAPDLLPSPRLGPAAAAVARGPPDEAFEDALLRVGSLLPIAEGGTDAAILACRSHIRAGVGLIVEGPYDELDAWRWSSRPEERGSCWRGGEQGGLQAEGTLRVGVGERRTKEEGVSLEDAYGRIEGGETAQLIDWPTDPALNLNLVLPEAMGSYHRMVPDPALMNMQKGELNLDSDAYPIPKRGVTGPFLYSGAAGTYTALHLDSSSALNVAVARIPTSSSVEPAREDPVALWVIVDREDGDAAAKCLARRTGESTQAMLHGHQRRIDTVDLYDLAEAGVAVRYAVQALGDRVVIPAGCLHFVVNVDACVKVAADFVAPWEVEAVQKVEGLRVADAYDDEDRSAWHHADISRVPANVLSALSRLEV